MPWSEYELEHLDVRLFGGLRLNRDGRELPPFPTRKAAALFGYLVLHRQQSVHREIICSHLWGDHSDAAARKSLRTALWRIRCVIEPHEADRGTYLRVDPHWVGFRPRADVRVDAWKLADAAEVRPSDSADGRLSDTQVAQFNAAVRAYTGLLMEGEESIEWTVAEAERYRLLHLAVLDRLMAYYLAAGDVFEALSIGHEILRHDPLLEHVHRAVMTCHVQLGDRASAVRQYRTCVDVLAKELELPPMASTIELNEHIVSGDMR
jgi:DNA-binding SARP family transcriptional activator